LFQAVPNKIKLHFRKYITIEITDKEEYQKNLQFTIELGEPRFFVTGAGRCVSWVTCVIPYIGIDWQRLDGLILGSYPGDPAMGVPPIPPPPPNKSPSSAEVYQVSHKIIKTFQCSSEMISYKDLGYPHGFSRPC